MIRFQNTYTDLPDSFYTPASACELASPKLLAVNYNLARSILGIDLKSIDEAAIKHIHAIVSAKSLAQADLAMRLMRALFNFAEYEYRSCDNEAIFKNNPVKILCHLRNWNHVPRKQTRISKTQLRQFFSAIEEHRNEAEKLHDLFRTSVCDFVEMAIFTGLRKSELLNLTWDLHHMELVEI